jgi:D-beta-D-heptose 7-phosphate kinase/D-beta-D-heptose 1-phosphate adenosyltransferase
MITTYQNLAEIRRQHTDDRIAYTGGCFDLLHEGHLDLLSRLHQFGNIAVVGVTPDERVRVRKGSGRPAHLQDTRITVVNALRFVDYAFIAPTVMTGYRVMGHKTLEDLRPDHFLTSNEVWEEDRDWLAQQGTELTVIPRLRDDISTTATIDRVRLLNQLAENQPA